MLPHRSPNAADTAGVPPVQRAGPVPSGPSLQSCMSVLDQGTIKLPCPSPASPHSPIFHRVFPYTTDPHKGPTPAKSPTAPVPSRKTTPWVLSGQALLPAPSLSAKVGRWSTALCSSTVRRNTTQQVEHGFMRLYCEEDTPSQQVEQTRKY